MVRRREFDKEIALDHAMEIFWEKGYAATSISDLTMAMGIQRPSLYATFGDKEQLFEAALRKYTNFHATHIRKVLQDIVSVKEAFNQLFDGLIEEEYKDQEKVSKGCFCINTIVELAPHDEKFEIITREHEMYLSVIFQETLLKGVKSGELESSLDVKALAQTLVLTLIGVTVLLKSRPDRLFVDKSIKLVLTLIK